MDWATKVWITKEILVASFTRLADVSPDTIIVPAEDLDVGLVGGDLRDAMIGAESELTNPPPPRAPSPPQTTIVAHQQVRIAPLPSPAELAQFEQVLPGLAERLVRMVEQNGEDPRRHDVALTQSVSLHHRFCSP